MSDSTLANYGLENKNGQKLKALPFQCCCFKFIIQVPYFWSAGSATYGVGAQVASSLTGEGGQDGADWVSQRQG